MKNYALYDKDGTIKKIISTTRKDVIEINLTKDLQYIEVTPDVKIDTHQIMDGEVVTLKDVNPKVFTPSSITGPEPTITEKDIDACKDVEGLKAILKQMIAPKAITFGKGV